MRIKLNVRQSGWLEVSVERDGKIRHKIRVSPAVIQLVINVVLFIIVGAYSYIHDGQFPAIG
jgi:hypothetical protein